MLQSSVETRSRSLDLVWPIGELELVETSPPRILAGCNTWSATFFLVILLNMLIRSLLAKVYDIASRLVHMSHHSQG